MKWRTKPQKPIIAGVRKIGWYFFLFPKSLADGNTYWLTLKRVELESYWGDPTIFGNWSRFEAIRWRPVRLADPFMDSGNLKPDSVTESKPIKPNKAGSIRLSLSHKGDTK